MKIEIICEHCGRVTFKETGHINRARKKGDKLYCSRKCAGMEKRKNLSREEKKEAKRLYDIEYRLKNKTLLKKKKAEAFKRNYYDSNNPLAEKMKMYRRKNQKRHNEYCMRPEYREKKHQYDRIRYAKEKFGPLWEIHVLAMEIIEEAQKRESKFEMMQQKGTINKAQKRRREYEKIKRG